MKRPPGKVLELLEERGAATEPLRFAVVVNGIRTRHRGRPERDTLRRRPRHPWAFGFMTPGNPSSFALSRVERTGSVPQLTPIRRNILKTNSRRD